MVYGLGWIFHAEGHDGSEVNGWIQYTVKKGYSRSFNGGEWYDFLYTGGGPCFAGISEIHYVNIVYQKMSFIHHSHDLCVSQNSQENYPNPERGKQTFLMQRILPVTSQTGRGYLTSQDRRLSALDGKQQEEAINFYLISKGE